MGIKKKIKRKITRIKQAKKAGAVPLPSTSEATQYASRRRKKGPVKLRGLISHPKAGRLDMELEYARLKGMRDAFQMSSVGLLANAVGSFVNGLNSCPNCDEPLPNGRYRIKCKCGYCRIGNTKELNSGTLITGMFAAAFGALAAVLTMNDFENSKKESEPKLLKERNNVISFIGDRTDKSPSSSGSTSGDQELFNFSFKSDKSIPDDDEKN